MADARRSGERARRTADRAGVADLSRWCSLRSISSVSGVFGFRTEVVGLDRLPRTADGRPAGGWIAAGLPHRTWVDPFVVVEVLPIEPRLIFFGDGRAIFRSRWRRWLVRRIGGVIPIWPGGGRVAVDGHLAAAAAALDAGAVLCLFPETGPPTPPGTARPFGSGLAYFALRTGAPIVPTRPGWDPRAVSPPTLSRRGPRTGRLAGPGGRRRATRDRPSRGPRPSGALRID